MKDILGSTAVRFAASFLVGYFLLNGSLLTGQEQDDSTQSSPPSNPSLKVTSFEELVKAFESRKIKVQSNAKKQLIQFTTTQGSGFESLMVVKWDSRNGVVHFIQTMPLVVKEEQQDKFLRAASTLNHGFLFPGIGMNPGNRGTYYRLSIPVSPRGYVWDFEIITYARFSLNKAAEFLPTLTAVLDDKVKIDGLLLAHQNRVREMANSRLTSAVFARKYTTKALGSDWVLDFGKESVQLMRDGKLAIKSSFSVKENEITFTDLDGPLASKDPATYRFVVENGNLKFEVASDSSKGRTKVITGDVWVPGK